MISEVPAIPPVTRPVAPIEATDVFPLIQVPPPAVLPNNVVAPAHTCSTPLIAVGAKFTVITAVAIQPAPVVYVIVAVPSSAPLTTPAVFTGAVALALLLHVPPLVASASAVVAPRHMPVLPEIADIGFTVTTLVTAHPAPVEYVIVAIPAIPPVTFPVPSTLAMLALLLVHVPPVTASLSAVLLPAHTLAVPAITVGVRFTVTSVCTAQPSAV